MNHERVAFFIIFSLLLSGSVLLFQRNEVINRFDQENQVLAGQVEDMNSEIQDLHARLREMESLASSINNSMISLLESLYEQETIRNNTYARVHETALYFAYPFQGSLNYTFSVNYSFTEVTQTIFTVLDADKETVLGYKRLNLIGQGVETVEIEIPLPETTMRWNVYPSVHWIRDETPVYDAEGWCKSAIIEVLSGSAGHIRGSCGDQSAVCHDYSN